MNKKRNRIILIVDLSDGSNHLVDFGFHLSTMINAEIVVVHQVIKMFPTMTEKAYRDMIFQIEIDEAKAKLRELTQGRRHESIIVSSDPILDILAEMQSSHYTDWVVGGLKKSSLMKRIFFGSTFIKIINNTNLLTVAVPISNVISVPEKILVAVTHKYSLNEFHLKNLLSNFKEKAKKVEFFTILNEGEDEETAREYLLQLQGKYSMCDPTIVLLKGGDKYNELKKFVEQSGHSFLVLQEGSRSLIDELFRKYMVNELIHAGDIPLIVLPNE
ncbi:nucleotide-binding universal stress UspA family protein [Algoriphagus sp. 4150]|uniref:universal stress protein n=1 Tax=Algoriphagus sp. 4150 TaxID=2817756 RepID=UPI00285C767C|nr:universal stress protein [Algoriphagus sp. 4150]MDR7129726.1 nucleotide-binding universal stress UspA family protein [Algoriphagus sp. 4150]